MNQGLNDRHAFSLVIQSEDLATIPSLHELFLNPFSSVIVSDPAFEFWRSLAFRTFASISVLSHRNVSAASAARSPPSRHNVEDNRVRN